MASTAPTKIDQAVASFDGDIEAEVNALSMDELKGYARRALRLKYYDRARSKTYDKENRPKRREYYHAVVGPKRKAARLAARQLRELQDAIMPGDRASREEPDNRKEPDSREELARLEEAMDHDDPADRDEPMDTKST